MCAYRPKVMSKDTAAVVEDSRYSILVPCICDTKEEKDEYNDDDNKENDEGEDEHEDVEAAALPRNKRKYSSNDNEEEVSISEL